MKEFDYIIIGGGCAGLSLAYELEINDKLKEKTLAIIETREKYKRDKTWSFWKVFDHNFEDCVIKSWNNFTINSSESSRELSNNNFPYQSIDSGKFYEKINSKLSFIAHGYIYSENKPKSILPRSISSPWIKVSFPSSKRKIGISDRSRLSGKFSNLKL